MLSSSSVFPEYPATRKRRKMSEEMSLYDGGGEGGNATLPIRPITALCSLLERQATAKVRRRSINLPHEPGTELSEEGRFGPVEVLT